jgi:hypothetical protein
MLGELPTTASLGVRRLCIASLVGLFFSSMHGQSEHEEEGDHQWCQAGPGRDPECVGREVVAEGREEDRAQDGDSERSRELLDGFQDTRGGADFVHGHAGEDELEELPDAGASACADEEEAGHEVPG